MTSIAIPLDTVRTWKPADGVPVRGHLVLLAGRGEHAGVYERFGRRLAFDGYRVSAVSGTNGDELATAIAAGAGTQPLVLAGADTGALRALALAGAPDLVGNQFDATPLAGLVLAGVPAASGSRLPYVGWAVELDARTACPTHRSRLADDGAFVRGTLSEPVPAALATVLDVPVELPVLILHGEADAIVPVGAARSLAARLRHAELAVVRDGRHDVLNDVHHRTVAGYVVGWLERLRSDPATAILSVERPAT